MTTAYEKAIKKTTATPQIEKAVKGQKKNAAGGYVFKITPMMQFRRFLILGSEGGTYYVSENKLTSTNTDNVVKLFKSEDGLRAVAQLVEVSDKGLAAKVSPTLYALALAFAHGTRAVKREAAKNFKTVVRTHSHLLEFVSYVDGLRGWGRLLRETVADWYNSMDIDKLGYQLAKYRNRSGWTTRDVLRMAHPKAPTEAHNETYKWAVGKEHGISVPKIVIAHSLAMRSVDVSPSAAAHLTQSGSLAREMVPTEWLDKPEVWNALLQSMPLTAMIRNLGKMTNVGLITPLSAASKLVASRLHDAEYIKRSRVHPFSVLQALLTYKKGMGIKGSLRWNPDSMVSDALEDAYYLAFGNVEPTNMNTMISLDVSGSMTWPMMDSAVRCCDGTAAMAMVIARTEPNYIINGFTTTLQDLGITAKDSLSAAIKKVQKSNFGGTDCAQPILEAMKKKIPAENFVVMTDNETWAGKIHPFQALKEYRQKMGIDAKLVVVGMTASKFSIADPSDPGMFDVVGFDGSVFQTISNFFRGNI